MARPPKHEHVEDRVRTLAKNGTYKLLKHARLRRDQRRISPHEIRHCLCEGWREPAKDEYDEQRENWKYSFRYDTKDGQRLRVIVALPAETMLVITVIDL